MKFIGIIFIVFSYFITSSCSSATISKTAQSTGEVYKYDLSVQCKPDSGVSLHDMKQELIAAGIDVISSRKDSDGKMRMTVCGSSTGKINIYKINRKDEEKAMQIGFQLISEIHK